MDGASAAVARHSRLCSAMPVKGDGASTDPAEEAVVAPVVRLRKRHVAWRTCTLVAGGAHVPSQEGDVLKESEVEEDAAPVPHSDCLRELRRQQPIQRCRGRGRRWRRRWR